jgi:arabinogalactan endo-1,4-beta-galactosidase
MPFNMLSISVGYSLMQADGATHALADRRQNGNIQTSVDGQSTLPHTVSDEFVSVVQNEGG